MGLLSLPLVRRSRGYLNRSDNQPLLNLDLCPSQQLLNPDLCHSQPLLNPDLCRNQLLLNSDLCRNQWRPSMYRHTHATPRHLLHRPHVHLRRLLPHRLPPPRSQRTAPCTIS